jgi:iron complex transport system ATP-binding protein
VSILETRDVSVERGGRTILATSSIAVRSGELLGVVGPNGSGKSTLLRVLAGLWAVKTGSVLLDGQSLATSTRSQIARRIAFVPQDTHVDFPFTVAEFLAMGRYPHRGRFSPETATDRAAIQAAARQCDITHLLQRSIETLSGGERQRALIARSLAVQPEFILLDEPTANLDVEHSLEVLQLSRTLAANGQAVVLASHDLNLVLQHATRVALLHAGDIVGVGSAEEVLTPDSIEKVFGVFPELVKAETGASVFVFHTASRHRP